MGKGISVRTEGNVEFAGIPKAPSSEIDEDEISDNKIRFGN